MIPVFWSLFAEISKPSGVWSSFLKLYMWDAANLLEGTTPSSLIRVGQQKKGRDLTGPENQVKAGTFRHHGDRLKKGTWIQS